MAEIIVAGRDLNISEKGAQVYCVVYYDIGGAWDLLFQTEKLPNQRSPKWSTTFIVNSCGNLKFEVMGPDLIGTVITTIQEIGQTKYFIKSLKQNNYSKQQGMLVVRIQQATDPNTSIRLQFSATGLKKTGILRPLDPYLKIFRCIHKNWMVESYQTEKQKSANPVWQEFELTLQTLASGDINKKILFQCYDQSNFTSHKFIGQCQTTLQKLISPGLEMALVNTKSQITGRIILQQSQVHKSYNFQQFINCGTQLKLMVAIDFTASNLDYRQPNSLHYVNESVRNEYEQVMVDIWNILQQTQQQYGISAYGFGGIPDWSSSIQVSDCFSLTSDQDSPQVESLEKLISLYHRVLPRISLSGPTRFNQIIRRAADMAKKMEEEITNEYLVLGIITDGDIHDFPRTRSEIIKASSFPLSILIIGVGNEDFFNMENLDQMETGLAAGPGDRNIVTFIPYRRLASNPILLGKRMLKGIPEQLTSYMKIVNKKPGDN